MVWHFRFFRFQLVFLLCLINGVAFSPVAFANVTFKKDQIEIGGQKLGIELAESPEQHAHGLMYRKSLPTEYGMLFVFPDESTRSFWMKNTFVDLSIGYFDREKKLIDIQDMKPMNSVMETQPETYVSKGPAKYALEVPQGWFKKHKIKVGQKFRFTSKTQL